MKYYDLASNWHKQITPHLNSQIIIDTLEEDFEKYTMGAFGKMFRLDNGQYPKDFERSEWRMDHVGPEPQYWSYVCKTACHWIANFSLQLAQLVLPHKQWRIITSQAHSTVWDGQHLLFDFNFQALGIPPWECYKYAAKEKDSEVLAVGQRLRLHFPETEEEIEERRAIISEYSKNPDYTINPLQDYTSRKVSKIVNSQ